MLAITSYLWFYLLSNFLYNVCIKILSVNGIKMCIKHSICPIIRKISVICTFLKRSNLFRFYTILVWENIINHSSTVFKEDICMSLANYRL